MTCKRGHSKWHNSNGYCDFIIGTLGVESAGHRAVLCGDYKIGEEPEEMLKV